MIGYSEQEFNALKTFIVVTPKKQLFFSKEEALIKYRNKKGLSEKLDSLLNKEISSFYGDPNHTQLFKLATKEELEKEYEFRLKTKGSRAEVSAYVKNHKYDHIVPTLKKYGNVYVGEINDGVIRKASSICDDYSVRPVSDGIGYVITIPSKYVETPVETLSENIEPTIEETEEDLDEKYMDDIEDIEEYENVICIDDIEDLEDDIIDDVEDVEEYEEDIDDEYIEDEYFEDECDEEEDYYEE